MRTGSATITIDRSPRDVWTAISDVPRIGEWSPECIAARWIDGASGPAVGVSFEGDNSATLGSITLKRWTTTSKIVACEPDRRFEFVASEMTTWRYDLEPSGDGTLVTESFAYEPSGFQGFLYDKVLRRSKAMTKGMQQTLARLKSALESPR